MKILSYIFFGILLFSQCTPKVADDLGKITSERAPVDIAEKVEDFRSMQPEPGPPRSVDLGSYDLLRLKNGIKLIVVENHKLPRVSYQLFLDRKELLEKEYAGLADIAGQMLNKGTKSMSKAEIDEAVDFLGASINTNARGGFASSLTKHTDKILELFADVILNPSFPEEEFEKIKKQTISGLQAQKEDPQAISGNVSNALVYGKDHPYGELVTETTVQNIGLKDCENYYQAYFKPNIAYVVVVGDITPEDARAKVEKNFGSWQPQEVPHITHKMPKAPEKTQVSFVDKAGAVQSVIDISYPLMLKPGDPDITKGNVMNMILGGSFSGRLNQNLREDKAYTYGSRSSLSSDELIGSFSAGASVRNEVTDSAIAQFLYELDKISSLEVDDTELDLAKKFMAGSFARNLESPQTIARFALNTERYNLPKDYYATYLKRLDAVTKDDVLEMAKKYVKAENAHIIVVGNQDEVAETLEKFDLENGKVTFYDIYANEKKPVEAVSGDVSAGDIINKYLTAIGGAEKLSAVNGVTQSFEMEIMGQSMEMSISQQAPNKMKMMMNAQGMTMMKQVFDGEKGFMEQMGQKQDLDEEMVRQAKKQARLFPERDYLSEDYSIELAGADAVDGQDCYKLVITDPAGDKSTEYYSQETGLKLKEVSTQSGQGQTVTVVNEYRDYKVVEGVMFPHIVKVSGMMPMPLEMKTKSITVNPEFAADEFSVN